MTWTLLTPDDIRNAQIITGATMVVLMFSHFFGRRAHAIRLLTAGAYFAAVAVYAAVVLLR